MTCVRCGGFVIIDGYSWPGEECDSREGPHAHCVNCGWVEDSVIRANRKLMAMGRFLHLNVRRVTRGPVARAGNSRLLRTSIGLAANFSTAVLARYPERLAVLPVQHVLWSDWGREVRIVDTLTRLGVSAPPRAAANSSRGIPAFPAAQ